MFIFLAMFYGTNKCQNILFQLRKKIPAFSMLCFYNFIGKSVSKIKRKLRIFNVKFTLISTQGQIYHSGKNTWGFRKRLFGFAASFMVSDS